MLFFVSETLTKWAFPISCLIYACLLATSFFSNNQIIRFNISLFMSLFSLSISIFFSGFNEKILNKIIIQISIIKLTKISKLIQFFFVAILAYLIWLFLISNPEIYKYIIDKGTIGDILTWLSIIVFFIDKNIKA